MSKELMVVFLGIVVAITPYAGIPEQWKVYITVASGIGLIFLGYLLRRKFFLLTLEQLEGERETDSYVENTKNLFADVDDR